VAQKVLYQVELALELRPFVPAGTREGHIEF
jgi:hypothetical protein